MLIKNPISYFHIGTFLLSGKKCHLLEYWKAEVIMRDKFVLSLTHDIQTVVVS